MKNFLLLNDKPKRSKNELDIQTKTDICMYQRDHPNMKNVDIIRYYLKTYNVLIPSSTMSDILKNTIK